MRAAARFEWPWVSMIVVAVCLLLALAPHSLLTHLSCDRQPISHGELWRLWTGHITHFSLHHALIDSTTLLLIGAIAESRFGPSRIALLLLTGVPLMSIGMLLASPALLEYRGASAITVMLAALVGSSLWKSRPSSRIVLGILAVCLIAKIGFDAMGMSITLADLPGQVRIAWQGHLIGGVLGGLSYMVHARASDESTHLSAASSGAPTQAVGPEKICRPY